MRNLPDNPSDYLSPSKKGGEDIFESRKDRAKAREAIDLFNRNYKEEEILTRLFGKVTPYRINWLNTHLKAAGL
nr:Mrr N-terminal domain protein [uncultured bacterium]